MLNNKIAFRSFDFVPTFLELVTQEQKSVKKQLQSLIPLKTNILETENFYTVTTEIPGLNKENISVKFENDILTISTQINEEKDNENKSNIDSENLIHQEIFHSNQSRSFRFENIVADTIEAKFENGILSLTLQKKPKENSKTINIV